MPRYGDFEVFPDRVIARGGSGAVIEGRRVSTGARIAVKVLQAPDAASAVRFHTEVTRVVPLDPSRHVAAVYGSFEGDGRHHLAMEWLPGKTLAEAMKAGRIPVLQAIGIAAEIADALEEAQKRGVVHRDLKPSNVFLLPDGHVKVIDFAVFHLKGKPAAEYASPELSMGLDVDTRSDLYSLGCLFHQMLAGRVPFEAPNPVALLAKHLNEKPKSIRESRPDVPEVADRAIAKLLEKKMDRRAQTPRELIHLLGVRPPAPLATVEPPAFAEASAGKPKSAVIPKPVAVVPPPPPEKKREAPPPPKRSAAAIVLILLSPILLAGAAAGFVYYKRWQKERLEASKVPIKFVSEPPGARVFLDGQDLGVTPLEVRILPGEHDLRLVLDGYIEFSTKVNPEQKIWEIALRKHGGAVRIVGLRDGDVVRLRVGGETRHEQTATTDTVVFPEVLPGTYEVRIEREDYTPGSWTLSVVDGGVSELKDFVMKYTAGGSLYIWSDPEGAEAFLDGTSLGKTPIQIEEFAPGRYVLKVKHPDRSDYEKKIHVRPGERTAVNATLPKLGWLTVRAHPAGCTITGDVSAELPFEGRVKAGRVRIRIEHAEAGVLDREVDVPPNGKAELAVDLWLERAKEHEGAGRIDDAIDAYRRSAIEDREKKARSLMHARAMARGDEHALREEWNDAIRWYQEALRAIPDDANAKESLERVRKSRKRDPAAFGQVRTIRAHSGMATAVVVSADGAWGASAGTDRVVKLRTLSDDRSLAAFGGPRPFWSVALSADKSLLAAGGEDGKILVWLTAAPSKEPVVLYGHAGAVYALAFSSDGKLLASGGEDARINLWTLATREPKALETHTDGVLCVALSPDGARLASGGYDKSLRIWDVAAAKEIRTLKKSTEAVFSAAFHPSGSEIAFGSGDGSIRIHDVEKGGELAVLYGHESAVHGLAWFRGGLYLVSGGFDRSVRVWDRAKAREIRSLTGHEEGVLSVAVDADGSVFFSAARDGALRVWAVPD